MGDCFNISVSNGKREDMTSKTKFFVIGKELLDFCCLECLIGYLGFRKKIDKDDTNYRKITM